MRFSPSARARYNQLWILNLLFVIQKNTAQRKLSACAQSKKESAFIRSKAARLNTGPIRGSLMG